MNTENVQRVLDYYEGYYRVFGVAPPVRQIAADLTLPLSTVFYYARKLAKQGKLEYTKRGFIPAREKVAE